MSKQSTLAIALGAWKRCAAPLLLLSIAACIPFAFFALSVGVPADRADAAKTVRFVWVFGACAWMVRIVLVGAIAEAARIAASGVKVSQVTMLFVGIRALARAALPCGVAIAAVVIGSIALVVPGLLLFVLLSMTGASERQGLAGPLEDSVDVARANLKNVAIVAGAMLLVDLAIVAVAYFGFATDMPAKPKAHDLAVVPAMFRVAAIGLAAVTPIAATAIAAMFVKARR